MSETIYSGNTVRIIRQNGSVRKVALPGFEAYLDNEWCAIKKLSLLQVPSSMVLSVGGSLETIASQRGITIPDFQSVGVKTLIDYLCVQEAVPLPQTRDKDKKLFDQLSTAVSQNVVKLTDEKITSRVSIFLQVLGISDTYIAHMSHNDISPSNIAVQGIGAEVRTSLFDLNNAVVYEKEGVKPFVPLSKPRPGYPILGGIPIAETWSHPDVITSGSLESLLAFPHPEKIFARNEVYQAANVLYWSLTGKRLQESSATVASQIPQKYASLAKKVDVLIAEVRKPIAEMDLEKIQKMRAGLSTALDSYKSTIPKPAAVPVVSAGFALPASQKLSTVIKPYTPANYPQVGAIVEAVKSSVDGYVKQTEALNTQLTTATTELAELKDSKQATDSALLRQRVYASLWRGAAIISTVAGLSFAVASGVIAYSYGKFSVPPCPSTHELCAASLDEAQGYKTILDAHCPSTTDYTACLDALATSQQPVIHACPVSETEYRAIVAQRDDYRDSFQTSNTQKEACNASLGDLQRQYRRLATSHATDDCSEELERANSFQDMYQRSAESWKQKDEECETAKKAIEAERDRNFQLAHNAHAPEREVWGWSALNTYLLGDQKAFCDMMRAHYIDTAIKGDLENVKVSRGERYDLLDMYDACLPVTTTTTTP